MPNLSRVVRRLAAMVVGWMVLSTIGPAAEVTITPAAGKLRVDIGGQLFTEYVHSDCAIPYLYPVIGPHRIGMTRNFPMKVIDGEAHDHPHHTSIWFAHDGLNGVDFWRSTKPGHGSVIHQRTVRHENGTRGLIETENRWQAADGTVVCHDRRVISFAQLPVGRVIDWDVTLIASQGDVHIQDTEEGTMGIRTHPNLRLENGEGVTTANGNAVNSQGVHGKAVWGKRAEWIAYWGEIDNHTVGIALLNHPQNLRHPTWWHARPYGLFTANPFGIHDFEKKPVGTGAYTIAKGERLRLRYRFVFHTGTPIQAKIPQHYQAYIASQR